MCYPCPWTDSVTHVPGRSVVSLVRASDDSCNNAPSVAPRRGSPLVPIVLCCLKGGLPADTEFRAFDPFVRARYR